SPLEHIDGIDNGVEVAEGPLSYDVSSHLSARVGKLNPRYVSFHCKTDERNGTVL
ncbi:unnamed protein product, partial [Laminaria digitata]